MRTSNNSSTMTTIPIPAGKIGVTISGTPPMVTEVPTDSPLKSSLQIGDVIDGLVIPHLYQVKHVQDSYLLREVLHKSSSYSQRALVLASNEEEEDYDVTVAKTTEFEIVLPPGKLGITFEGDSQPTIRKVWDYCPVAPLVEEGQWLKSIKIPGEPTIKCSCLSARDVYDCLRAYGRVQGRVVVLIPPPVAVAQPVSASCSMDECNSEPSYQESLYSTVSAEPMRSSHSSLDATIEQEQVVSIQLFPKQRLRCNHEHMICMSNSFTVKTHTMRKSEFRKGYPLGLTEFVYQGNTRGTASFGANGKIIKILLEDYGGRVTCQAKSYLCSDISVKPYVESVKDGEMMIRLCGHGHVWLSAESSGPVLCKSLKMGETMQCATGALLAYEKSVQCSSHSVRGGLMSTLSGSNKDCSWTELAGPGTVWLQGVSSASSVSSEKVQPKRESMERTVLTGNMIEL